MKKLVSISLCLVIIFSLLTPVASATKGKCDCGELPMIYVGPLGNTDIYENPGTENERVIFRPDAKAIISIIGKFLPSLMTIKFPGGYEHFGDALIKSVSDSFGAMALDGNGNSAKNVDVKLELPTDKTHGYGKDYYFHYDWRLDPIEVAGQLNDFVKHIKKLTGHDKVHFKASSMGGIAAMAYFHEYGYKDVDSCIFQCCPLLGTAVAGDLLCRKMKLDAKALYDYGTNAFPPADAEGVFLTGLFNFLYYSGLVDIVLCGGEKILDKLQERVFDELMTPVFGTLLGIWAFVPADTYEQAKKINLDPKTQAGLIKKADYYHYEVQGNADKILKNAQRNGVRIMIVAGYNIQRTPLVESIDNDSDGTVDTMYASAGATVAKINGTLGENYKQKKNCGHNHISPDNRIDASTCILPENTWFIKDMLHSNGQPGITEMYNKFAWGKEIKDVWSSPFYTQFLQNDKPNGRVIAMGNFAKNATAPKYEKGESFYDFYKEYALPTATKIYNALDKIKDFFVK